MITAVLVLACPTVINSTVSVGSGKYLPLNAQAFIRRFTKRSEVNGGCLSRQEIFVEPKPCAALVPCSACPTVIRELFPALSALRASTA